MTVYQLNGFDLPRTSKEQSDADTPVEKTDLLKGDLIFFATAGKGKATHVGVYVGDGRFIHASGKGKKIRVDHLSGAYYKKRYIGGRTYI
jgi:cell wall-associated NlpC family hydrolase